ncbi:hypothetical protein AAC387_Pa07g3714 [Persea americana]
MEFRSVFMRRFLLFSVFILQTPVAAPVPSIGLFLSARVVTDRVSGYSKCFGFVKYATIEKADQGIKGMNEHV